tara:strand:+ start:586 stop:1542 length:957 start_codon:yes stop_codon:yes gene_type:complete
MSKVFVAGHNGMVGAAICRQLSNCNVDITTANRDKVDLTDQSQVRSFFKDNNFDQVYLAAAKVGGIFANDTYPAEFIYENLMIQNNVIHQSFLSNVKKLIFLGSSCIYPKLSKQPMVEEALLTGNLEPTNEPYAIAKIAGIKMCESYNRQYDVDYRSIMPTNLYGPGDNYHPENSHVIPALIRRFHEAKERDDDEVVVWGSGAAMREFLHVDDMASAALHIMNLDISQYKKHTSPMLSHLNIGTGIDCSIKELTETIAEIVDFNGHIKWDLTKPDGSPRKLMNSEKLNNLGWQPNFSLKDGLIDAYDWYEANLSKARH